MNKKVNDYFSNIQKMCLGINRKLKVYYQSESDHLGTGLTWVMRIATGHSGPQLHCLCRNSGFLPG